MIELKNISKNYLIQGQAHRAIDGLSLTIQTGDFYGIVGESGAGKSTLLRFINLLEVPSQGQVLIDGEDIVTFPPAALRQKRKSMSMVFQHFNLLNNKTVRNNITLPLDLFAYQSPLSAEDVLDFVGLADKANAYPHQLSGGQKQRIGIARALITKPKILLCDEPTSALDASRKDEIAYLLHRAHQEFKMTIVLVTHELDLVQQLCQRVAILEQGKLVKTFTHQPHLAAKAHHSYSQRVLEVLGQ